LEAVATCLNIGASSGGASLCMISSRPGFCRSICMQLKIYSYGT